ncbi:hypothetical protein R3I93_019509 [Phoxinus phoxinus]|uniref:Uncharacterized protein n=1 Tax=Phoxinus phoxinus TaxID=58324 RepID=A0AAN9CDK3_9TELE
MGADSPQFLQCV